MALLASGAGLSKGQVAWHGLFGIAINIVVDNRANKVASHFRHRALTVCTKHYLEIAEFPQAV
jgi:hypothetical protein